MPVASYINSDRSSQGHLPVIDALQNQCPIQFVPSRLENALYQGTTSAVRTAANDEGFKGARKEPPIARRNQSRRDGTICSPARECRVGFSPGLRPISVNLMGTAENRPRRNPGQPSAAN